MPKEIVINVSGEQSRIAIVEDGELVELYVENPENVRTIGDIYLAKVKRILPGIKAAFVDIGQKQDAFLHFSDLSDNVPGLLELSDGRIPERSESLTKAPPNAPDDLEVETDEEKEAAKRRRQLKQQPSKRQATREPTSTSEDSAPQATSEKATPRRRGRRRDSADTEAVVVPAAPAILPPEADNVVAAPPGSEPTSPPDTSEAETDAGRPKRKRRRGRRRSASEGEDQAAAVQADPASAEAASKPRRSGTTRGKRSGANAERSAAQAEPARDADDTGSSKRDASCSALEVATTVKPPSRRPDAPEEESTTSTPRLAPGSKFRIDLTASPSRREEEEEEEERTSASRRRRSTSKRPRNSSRKDSSNSPGGNGRDPSGKPPETYLKQDQKLLVKIIKEPISAKGSRVSTDISLAGRFLVLIPAADYVAVSKKIESSKERRRLRALARSLLPEGFGLIVRTVAANREAKVLDTDLQLLLRKWAKIEEQLKRKPSPPVKLYEDVNMVSSIIRDLFTDDYDRIIVDDPKAYRNIKSYVQAVAPQMAEAVQLHQRKEAVFHVAGIEKDVRAAFEGRVGLPGGGYLFIEHTEAMHVVDVNSGRAGKGLTQEENALKVNLEAAREIAKQLRLRDLGGIICVDFIDMRSDAYRRKVYDELKRAFVRDRAVTKLLPMSDFGVLEITRQRLRPSITTTLDVDDVGMSEEDTEVVAQPRPTRVAAPAQPASEIVAHLERWLATYRDEVLERHRKRPILLRVHPFLGAYLQRGIPSLLTKWRFKSRLKLVLEMDDNVDPLTFTFRDEKSGKNLTKKYDPDRRDTE